MWGKDNQGELRHSWRPVGTTSLRSRLWCLCNAVWALAIELQIDQSVGRWVSGILALAKLLVGDGRCERA